MFNIEDNSENITNAWEHLYPGGTIDHELDCDSESESRSFQALSETDNLLWRTSYIFMGEQDFFKKFKGSITWKKPPILPDYAPGIPDYGKLVFRTRFLAQYIIAEALNLLQAK